MKYLNEEWLSETDFILYGLGDIGKKCVYKFFENFNIITIIDNDEKKQGLFAGIQVQKLNEVIEIAKIYKIIVMTGGKEYRNIAYDLEKIGLKEYKDFCSIEIFISDWYWEKLHLNCLLEVHTAVTMRCTLQCKNCNMFVPYYKKIIEYDIGCLKKDYDLLFQSVDYVFCIALLGGEPFLYNKLDKLIEYLHCTYSGKFGRIEIISNGTMIPEERVIVILKRYNVLVRISDYSNEIPYQGKIKEVIKILQEEGIECIVQPSKLWKDFGFPKEKAEHESKTVREHMLNCAPIFHGLNDNKFYFCHVSWSAEKSGLYNLTKNDYIDLNQIDCNSDESKRQIVEHGLGGLTKGYVSLCEICGGCGSDNSKIIKAGVQEQNGK